MKNLHYLSLLVVIAIVVAGAYLIPRASAQSQSGFVYNGITHVSWWFDEYDSAAGATSRAALRDTGANWMGLLVTWYQQDASSTVIARHPDPNKDISDARIRAAIQDAHSRGLQVMLKPHVDALNGQWRGDFNPSNPAAWFQSYTQFIVHYAQIAQQEGAELLCMGTEFKTISGAANRDRWVAVINAIRGAYGGLLTYAANATFPADEFTSVSFWDQLDVIGLDGYFTLTNQNNPTLAQLISAWTSNANGENIVAAIQNFASSRQKPVIFTEIGYKSTDGANTQPWNFGLSGAVDTAEQRDCYEAAFTVWSQQSSWMKGFFWWAWPVPPPPANDGDYNPRGKPAETVLRTWQGPGGPNFTLSASPSGLTINQGASGTSAIAINRSGGFTSGVTLSATGLPSGVTATFNPSSPTGTSSALTLAASSTAATGTFNVTINGSGGGLNRSTTLSLTVNQTQTPNFTLSASPSSLTINRGASGTSAIAINRSGGFTSGVTLSATGLPSGVTATFNPVSTTGGSSTLTLAASSAAATGMTSVTINGTGGGLTRSTTLILTINAPPTGNGGVTVTPAVTTNSPWYNEEVIRLDNAASLTALSVTITIQRTTGVGFNGMYNTVGGQIQQGNTITATAITYQFTLAPGQTLGPGTGRTFAAQTSGSGTLHPTAGDTWVVSYTTGGITYTQTGHF